MTDPEIDRAIAEKLEPLGLETRPIRGKSPLGLWIWCGEEKDDTVCHGWYPRRFAFSAAASMALWRALHAGTFEIHMSQMCQDDARVVCTIYGSAKFVDIGPTPMEALRNAAAKALGIDIA